MGRFLIPFNGVHSWAFASDSFIEPYLGENSPKPFMYSPYWDEGVMLRGRLPLGDDEDSTLNYTLYVINGFDRSGLDGIHKRDIGDNNQNKTIGGRASLDMRLGGDVDLSVGTSFLLGKYDPESRLEFFGIEADAQLSFGDLQLYVEAFHRPHELEAPVAENPSAVVGKVARLSGLKVRPSVRLLDDLRLFAQVDALRLRQPRLTNGFFSALDLDKRSTVIWTYLVGAEYEFSEHVSATLEFGLFDRRSGLGPDISFAAITLYVSF